MRFQQTHLTSQLKNARLSKQLVNGYSAVIDRLYWTALSRAPTEAEIAASMSVMGSYSHDRGAAVEDIAWALLNAKEFLFRR